MKTLKKLSAILLSVMLLAALLPANFAFAGGSDTLPVYYSGSITDNDDFDVLNATSSENVDDQIYGKTIKINGAQGKAASLRYRGSEDTCYSTDGSLTIKTAIKKYDNNINTAIRFIVVDSSKAVPFCFENAVIDRDTQVLSLSGTVTPDAAADEIIIMLLKPGKSAAALDAVTDITDFNNTVEYFRQIPLAQDGSFGASAYINNQSQTIDNLPDEYTLVISRADFSAPYEHSEKVLFYTAPEVAAAKLAVNTAAQNAIADTTKKADLITALNNNAGALDIDLSHIGGISVEGMQEDELFIANSVIAKYQELGTFKEKIGRYILENYSDQSLCAQSIASHFGLSGSYLSEKYKSETGESLHHLISKVRVDKAKELMESSNLTLEKVAEQVGFCDTQALRRAFKRHEGVLPSNYRRK